jgi:hypothetical protein
MTLFPMCPFHHSTFLPFCPSIIIHPCISWEKFAE